MSQGRPRAQAWESLTFSGPAHTNLFEARFPQPCQPPTAEPIDTGSLFHPACLGCRRVTAVPCLITDGLRRCQPMNKITVFLQCKFGSSLVEGLCGASLDWLAVFNEKSCITF